jgi:hypothetical protein
MLGPKNHDVRTNQAPVAKVHWSHLRVRLTAGEEVVKKRKRKARVVQAQAHLRKRTLRRLRLDAKACVAAKGWGWEVREGSDVSR